MKKNSFILLSFFLSAFFLAKQLPEMFVVNVSRSLPRGLYRVSPVPPAVGDYVVINSDGLPFTVTRSRLLKKIAYGGGEPVYVGRDGLAAGGRLYPRSRDIGIDYCGRLQEGECVILGDSPRSFDSRYFGPVRIADCVRVVPLVLIDGGP